MKKRRNFLQSIYQNPAAWWLTVFTSTLAVAILWRLIITKVTLTETLFYADIILCTIFWVALQVTSLPIVKRLFGTGFVYDLTKATVAVTNPISMYLLYLLASFVRFTDLTSFMRQWIYDIPRNALDWLGYIETLVFVSILFLVICALRYAYLKKAPTPWRKLRPAALMLLVGATLLVSYQFIPSTADRSLAAFLKPQQYSVNQKQPMWSCCMVRDKTTEFSATDIYYKVSQGSQTRYFHASDTSSSRGFERGAQTWKISEINQQSYTTSIQPW